MKKFLYYPVKNPINQTNLFGANPSQYKPLGQQGHPGNDFASPSGTPLYSPCDGLAFYTTDSLGGDGIWIRTTQEGENYNIILWHMPAAGNPLYPFQISTDRSLVLVKAGQLLGYTDNSGAPRESTGPHLHLGIMPADENWHPTQQGNGFLGCVDPAPFYLGLYAEDIAKIGQILTETAGVITAISHAQITDSEKSSFLESIKKSFIALLKYIQK